MDVVMDEDIAFLNQTDGHQPSRELKIPQNKSWIYIII